MTTPDAAPATHVRRSGLPVTFCGETPIVESISFEHFTASIRGMQSIIAKHVTTLPAPLCDRCSVRALLQIAKDERESPF